MCQSESGALRVVSEGEWPFEENIIGSLILGGGSSSLVYVIDDSVIDPPSTQDGRTIEAAFIVSQLNFDSSLITSLLPVYTSIPAHFFHNAVVKTHLTSTANGEVYPGWVQWTSKTTSIGARLGLLLGPDRDFKQKTADASAIKDKKSASSGASTSATAAQ
jgi:hypothetical protein